MTYAKSIGKAEIDWEKVFKDKDDTLTKEMGGWEACPNGQLPVEIPRLSSGTPIDKVLEHIGVALNAGYTRQDYTTCLLLLQALNQRAKLVLLGVKETLLQERTELENKLARIDKFINPPDLK